MGPVPVLKPRQVVAFLERHGFVRIRQRGSHKQFRHADGRGTTVPFHAGRDMTIFDNYDRYDAVGLAHLVREGATTAGELLETAIARLEAVDPLINACRSNHR